MIVGLAGKFCSGKNMLLPVFERHGFELIDADRIGHEALEANQEAVKDRFGEKILTGEGSVDRRALGKIVFSDPAKLAELEAIVHPWISDRIRHLVASSQKAHVLINAALLHKMGLYLLCDAIVWVQAPFWTRAKRARIRDGLGWKQIFQRIWVQKSLSSNAFSPDVDTYIVDNRTTPERARKVLEGLLNRLGLT